MRRSDRDEPEEHQQKALVVAKQATRKAVFKVLPYGAQLIASAAAYTLGVTATQVVGYCLRISCCTPVFGPCLGMIGVGFASVLAGQASIHTQKLFQSGGNPLRPKWWKPLDLDDVLLDSMLGIFMFKVAGGRFRSLMPSNLAAPGALAFESIPARNEEYARPGIKRELARIFRRDGCHHCGSHKGPVIGDHMPPNKTVYSKGGSDLVAAWFNELPVIRQVRAVTGAKTPRIRQRFYPQCQKCSIKQATAMRNNKQVLVMHMHAPRYRSEHLAGVFVGLRYNVPPYRPPPGGNGGRKHHASTFWNPLSITAALGPPPLQLSAGSATVVASNSNDGGRQRAPLLARGPSPTTSRGSSGGGAVACTRSGSGGVQMLQQREDVEVLQDRFGADQHVKPSHQEMSASFQQWVGRQGQHGCQADGHGAAAPVYRGVRQRMAGDDADVESDVQPYEADGRGNGAGQELEDAKHRAHAAFQRHFTRGLDY